MAARSLLFAYPAPVDRSGLKTELRSLRSIYCGSRDEAIAEVRRHLSLKITELMPRQPTFDIESRTLLRRWVDFKTG
jgi:hypothetical protein